jgi:hypothetical protein
MVEQIDEVESLQVSPAQFRPRADEQARITGE